ncbi:MAG: hypothetical protein ACE5G2_00545 [Candidatus Krumholzibacteriia bacterium]
MSRTHSHAVPAPTSAGPNATAPDVTTLIRALRSWLEDQRYVSYDPYDGLTSQLLHPLFRHPLLARVCLQTVKRSPLNLRPVLGIRKRLYTKSLSDLVSAQLLLFRLDADVRDRDRALGLLDQLRGRMLPGHPGSSWGMDLPYVSRFVTATPATPNLFQTVNAAVALLDAYDVTGEVFDLDLALGVVEFLEHGLGMVEESSDHVVWRYYPGKDTVVYNVNALVGSLLARLAKCAAREDLARLAERTIAFVLLEQNADGSWFYARGPQGCWIDGFHTGYVLEALLEYARITGSPAAAGALERGADFFRQHLLEPSGLPRYTERSLHPIDVQNCAQAVQLLSKLALSDRSWLPWAEHALASSAQHLLIWSGPRDAPRARFRLQRGRWFRNDLPAIRWGQAPMLLALAWLHAAQHGLTDPSSGRTPAG